MALNSYAKPFLTSNDLINSVLLKISAPLSQNLFSKNDILTFANQEMFCTEVPALLEFHEEYLVFIETVPIVPGQNRYPIPSRAIGQKLRDLKWQDTNLNLFDMSRVNPEEKAFYQLNIGTSETISKYYIEGNYVVLLPARTTTNGLNLVFYYFLRPNQLVVNERASTITAFLETITTLSAHINVGDTVTIDSIVFTAVTGAPANNTQFQVNGMTDIQIASNLVAAINSNGVAIASNGVPNTSLVTITFQTIQASQSVTTSNSAGFVIPPNTQIIQFDQVPSTFQDPVTFQTTALFTTGALVDFLQTNPGHQTYTYDIPIVSISGNTVSFLASDLIQPQPPPSQSTPPAVINCVIGDYICLANECIIPQIPPDLHTQLAQRTATMVLAALGDQVGLQASTAKVAEMEKKQISVLDARVEGSPLKIAPKHSLLRYLGFGSRRRRL